MLAAAIVPMVLMTLSRALKQRFDRHAAIARRTLPLWLYVSVTGVVIYVMLYRLDLALGTRRWALVSLGTGVRNRARAPVQARRQRYPGYFALSSRQADSPRAQAVAMAAGSSPARIRLTVSAPNSRPTLSTSNDPGNSR